MSDTQTSSGYTLTIKVSNSFAGNGAIPHAFVTISGPDLAAVTVGYYPKTTGVSGAGTVRNDALSHEGSSGMESHPFDQSLTFEVSPQQALNALNFAASTANNPGQYQLLGADDKNNLLMQDGYQCTGFARDVARAAGIVPQAVNTGADDTIYPSTLGGVGVGSSPTNLGSYPGSLMREFGGLDSNQVQPFRSAPDAQAFAQARTSLYGGIAAHDPADLSGVDARIKPVGEVVLGATDDSSHTDAAIPDKPATVFNPATTLPSYSGDNAVTVQSGDTVSSIAKRYDMTVEEFSGFLKTQYGEGADLNSIVAGRKLPLPQDVYERTSGGVNGLDLPPDAVAAPASNTDAHSQVTDAFNKADQTAADLKTQYPNTVQVADAEGSLTEINPDNSSLTLQGAAAGVGLFNAISNVQNWDHLSDLGKLSALAGLHNALAGVGTDLQGDFSGAAGWLSFAQGIESGNVSMTVAGLNSVSDQAVDGALNSAFGSSGIPYVSVALAINNFEANPTQSIGTMVGMYFGGPLGGMVGGFIGGALGGLFGGGDPPPPPEGAVHFSWDASGHIQHTVDFNQSGGGDAANSVAASVQTMLQSLVDAHNAQTASSADDIAINPYLLPKFGFSGASAWMEVALPDGTTVREGINQESFAQRLLEVLQDNGAIAPAWQVQTQLGHYQHALQEGQSQEQAEAPLRLGAGGQAYAGNEAFSLQGNAAESADFKSQTFGALVIHLNDNPQVQAAHTQLGNVLRDVEGDGYFEQTQTVAAQDSAGNLQAVLTIDFNGDGVIQTRDILNLGGNTSATEGASQLSNPTDEAHLANANANQQRNNVQWLDANGDGVLDKSDPAFAAIKLWVDVNQDGVQQGNEASGPSAMHISRINFKTGEVTYEDGHTDALTAQTLQADTEGVKLTQINEVNPDGTLHALDAGMVVEHEGYQGKVQITDEGGTRWASEREQTYEQQAKRTGDWEGTAEQDAHRHGGGNVDGAPTETTATGAADFGPVKTQANVITQSTVEEGDGRVVSDAPTQAPQPKVNAQTTVAAGDSRVSSNASAANTNAVNATVSNANNASASPRIAFVPTTQVSAQSEIKTVTADMIESSQSLLFGGGSASLGVLAALGTGATASAASAAEVAQRPVLVSEVRSSEANANSAVVTTPVSNSAFTTTANHSVDSSTPAVTFKQVDLGVLSMLPVAPSSTPAAATQNTATSTVPINQDTPSSTFVQATVIVSAPASTPTPTSVAINKTSTLTTATAPDATPSAAPSAPTLAYPVVQAETLQGTEDVVLRLSPSVLLANDSSPNAVADPTQPALTITAVSAPLHGQVSLVNGEVLFAPDINFHGTASFTYTVTDQYGLSTTGTATLEIAAVNDTPVTQGETSAPAEDTAIVFTQAELLRNDSDVDMATDGQVLNISAVGGATNGAVSLLANGDVRFVPNANYHGPAEFTYTVSDGNGGATDAKVNLTITAVNDTPVAVGDIFTTAEDTTTVLTPQQLLANDTDNDMATDADVLSITRVFAPQHCTATLNADGTVSFTPETNYHGNVRFSYEITDTQGATSTAFVVAGVNAVNDAPVGYADSFSRLEDNIVTLNQADLLGNDTDSDIATDGDVLRVASVGNATNGQVRLLTNGQIEFVPDANFHGTATFDYVVSDSFGATSTSTVTLQVDAVNDAPVVGNERDTATEDVAYTTTATALLNNDSDVDTATDGQVLTIDSVGNAEHGVVAMDVNGRITFTPDANYHGAASFTYVVDDDAGGMSTGRVTLNVQAVNDAPVTQGENKTSDEDTDVVLTQAQLLGNDSDVDTATDGQSLRISAVSGATNGTVTLLANGDVRFRPNLDYHGPAEFTYTVSDGNGGNTDAKVNLTIMALNDAPVVVDDVIAAIEDMPFYVEAASLLANDSDVDVATDGQVLSMSTVSAIAGQTHGTVNLVVQPDGSQRVTFVPDANYHGVAKFNYTVSDGNGGFSTAVAVVNLSAVNDAPVTTGEKATSNEDIPLLFTSADLLANDTDVDVATDGQVLSISRVGNATHGTVTLDAQGQVRFRPDTNYHGAAQFTYWVSDGTAANGAGAETPATMSLTIAAVNDIPVAKGESTDTTEDTTLLIDAATLLANDSDVDVATDGQVLSISALSNAAHCTVTLVTQADGTQQITFLPDANFHGAATFDYTVSDGSGGTSVATAVVNLSAVNDAPVTTGEKATSNEDIPLLFTSADLLANDTDVDVATDGQVLSISRVGNATHGTVTLDAQGQVRFRPDTNYHGAAQFTYWVSDGSAADGAGAEVPATVSLTILAFNDLPVVTGETVNTNEDTPLLFDPATLLANDTDVDVATDGQVLSITGVGNATHGTAAFVTQTDGSQRIAFTPESNYFGVASYQYTVSDGNGGNTVGTVVVNLAQVNDTPLAANDSLSSTAEDTALHISFSSLLGNDTDADSHNAKWSGTDDVLTVSAVGNATHGTVAIVNGEVVFIPDSNYHGPASFEYQITDSDGAVSQAMATFAVTAVNDLPVAVGETISENEDTTLVISQAALLQNDSDVDTGTDGQVLSITAVFNAKHGSVTLNTNGTISFVPDTNYYGNASFDYTVNDGNGGTATATATIALANVNDAPVATGETINSNEDQVLAITASALLQNDSDIDNARADLTISRVQSGTGGSVSLNASGNVVFTPTANYNGTATFTYWVKDPGGLESNAVTTTVVLAPVNDAPTAQGETVTGASEDAVLNISKSTLLANDHDIDNPDSDLSLSWVGNATGGTVSLNANRDVVFTPTANFNGNASFSYKVRDAAGLESAVVQAVIPVVAVNDTPVAVDDQFTTYNNSTLTVAFNQLTSNDFDVEEGNALTVSAVRDHANGHASIVNGQVQFVANAGFVGAASFDYLADDGHGGQTWATAFVDVKAPPNQYPIVEVRQEAAHSAASWFGSPVSYSAGNYLDKLVIEFSTSDDGPGPLTMELISAKKYSFYGINASVANFSWWGWEDGVSGVALDMTNRLVTLAIDGNFEKGFNQYQTVWKITDERGLSNIWHYNEISYQNYKLTSESYCERSGYYMPPVILDLNGDSVHFTSLQNSNVTFDVNFDGIQDKMAWAANDDGVLVWDKDHNGSISDASEFGFQSLKAGAQTDLEGLQALDTNGDGFLDAADAKFAEFAVWQDANGNGMTDAGEFKTLNELGIASINLHSDGQVRDAGTLLANSGSGETDATVMGNTTFTRTDGSIGVAADTMLAYEAGHAPLVAADAQAAEIMRQALVFNQVCNTASAIDSTPLGFVPIAPDVQLHDMLVAVSDNSVHHPMQSA